MGTHSECQPHGERHLLDLDGGTRRLSPVQDEKMPPHLRACSFTGNQFFEEDCSWCAVVMAFPQAFNADQILSAAMTYHKYYAKTPAQVADLVNFPAP